MTTIGFVSWKGGTGKTLLAFNTAERATAAGIKTVLQEERRCSGEGLAFTSPNAEDGRRGRLHPQPRPLNRPVHPSRSFVMIANWPVLGNLETLANVIQ